MADEPDDQPHRDHPSQHHRGSPVAGLPARRVLHIVRAADARDQPDVRELDRDRHAQRQQLQRDEQLLTGWLRHISGRVLQRPIGQCRATAPIAFSGVQIQLAYNAGQFAVPGAVLQLVTNQTLASLTTTTGTTNLANEYTAGTAYAQNSIVTNNLNVANNLTVGGASSLAGLVTAANGVTAAGGVFTGRGDGTVTNVAGWGGVFGKITPRWPPISAERPRSGRTRRPFPRTSSPPAVPRSP